MSKRVLYCQLRGPTEKQRAKILLVRGAQERCSSNEPRRLSARHLLKPTQGFDLIIEPGDAIHRIEHHYVGAEPPPAVCLRCPALWIPVVHAQPTLNAKLCWVAPERPELFTQCPEFFLSLRIGFDDRHPAVSEPGGSRHYSIGQAAKPDRDRPLRRWRHDTDLIQVVESTAEANKVFRPQA